MGYAVSLVGFALSHGVDMPHLPNTPRLWLRTWDFYLDGVAGDSGGFVCF